MVTPSKVLDKMLKNAIKSQMALLFGANCLMNDSQSLPKKPVEGGTISSDVESKTVREVEPETKFIPKNKKRKILSVKKDDDWASTHVLTPDDVTSEQENTCVDEDFKSEKKRRRRNNKTGSSDQPLIVVLDVDECLIHFRTQDELQKCESKPSACHDGGDEENRENMDTKETEHLEFMLVNENKVFLRPGLIEFLKFVTSRFETHIFTAGTKVYADSILDQLCLLVGDLNAFSKRWYRDDCETINIFNPLTALCIDCIYVKPLSRIAEWAGRDAHDLRRIVHIDDQARNFLLNHGNGIPISEWRGDNPDDIALSEVIKVLQKIDAENVGDVRPLLRNELCLTLKNQLDMITLFPCRRTKGIQPMLL